MSNITIQIDEIINDNIYNKICLISERFNINKKELLIFLGMNVNVEKRNVYNQNNIEDEELMEDMYEYVKE
jgi:hypothetical protein